MHQSEFSLQTTLGIALHRDLKAIDVVKIPGVTTNDMETGYIWHCLPLVNIAEFDLSFALCFYRDRLDYIRFSIHNPELYGHGWSDWSEENEKKRAVHTEKWLNSIGYSTGSFSWGEIWVGYESKSGFGHGVVRYL